MRVFNDNLDNIEYLEGIRLHVPGVLSQITFTRISPNYGLASNAITRPCPHQPLLRLFQVQRQIKAVLPWRTDPGFHISRPELDSDGGLAIAPHVLHQSRRVLTLAGGLAELPQQANHFSQS